MPTYAFRIEETGDVIEIVFRMSDPTPTNVKELIALGFQNEKNYNPEGLVTKLINAEGGFSIYGPGVYKQGYSGGTNRSPTKQKTGRHRIKTVR